MEYGRIIDGNVHTYLSIELENGGRIYNPSHIDWLEFNYLPIVNERPVDIDGYHQQATFEVVDNIIVYTYNYVKNTEDYGNV